MKVMKKLAALLLAGALAATAALPTFAAFVPTAPWTSTETVTVTNLAESTKAMTAYKIIEASADNDPQNQSQTQYTLLAWAKNAIDAAYTGNERTEAHGFKAGDNGTVVDDELVIKALGGTVGEKPGEVDDKTYDSKTATNELLTVLANAAKAKTPPTGFPEGISAKIENETATFKDLAVGSYVVLAEDPTAVYNPMEISVGLADLKKADGELVGEGETGDGLLDTVVADGTVAKYSTFDTSKDITDGDTVKENLSSASVGDVVEFTLNISDTPNYPANAANKTLYMEDTPSAGLTLNADSFKMYVAGSTEAIAIAADNKFTSDGNVIATLVQGTEGNKEVGTFAIVYNYDNLNALIGTSTDRSVKVEYTVTVNTNAVVAGEGNSNDYTVVYSRNPSQGTTYTPGGDEGKPIKPGKDSDGNKETDHEQKTVYTYGLAVRKVNEVGARNEALKGAQFGVYTDKACTNLLSTLTINEKGDDAQLVGIEAGTYYIKETVAPEGYALNNTVVAVVVNHNTSQIYSSYKTTADTTSSWEQESEEVFMTKDEADAWTSANPTSENSATPSDIDVTGNTTGTTTVLTSAGDIVYYRAANGSVYTKEELDKFTTRPSTVEVKKYTVTTTYTSKETTTSATLTTDNNYQTDAHAMAIIQDNKVGNLPSTGGMGTTLFYVIGGLLIVAAAIVIISKRRVQEG